MASETVQLGKAESRRVAAALGRAVALPRAGRVRGAPGARAVGTDDVVLAVVSSEGAVVQRCEVRGRPIDLRELRLRLMGAEEAVEQVAQDRSKEAPPLTPSEDALLVQAGLTGKGRADVPGALERTRIALELMLRESWSLKATARALHVKTTSRLRQRLAAGTLYGVKVGRSWRVPRFQFARGKLVRGIDLVFPHVRRDAHPVAVKRWFTSPHQDLVVEADERPITPLAWLQTGNPPDAVARLASEI